MINSPLLRQPEMQTPETTPLVESPLTQPRNWFGPSGATFGRDPDTIARILPPWTNGGGGQPVSGGLFGGGGFGGGLSGMLLGGPLQLLENIIQQLGALVAQFASQAGSQLGNLTGSGDNEQYFQSANAGSNGDPHLSFNGQHWDSMVSQPDLLHSDSIPGGYQVSTQVTPPNANGVTYNQSATIATSNGMTSVTLDNNGACTLTQNGQQIPVQNGQTIDLGNGQTLTRDTNGKVQLIANNGMGGQIATSLSENGAGVDVNVQANNVDLGGALATNQSIPSPGNILPPPHFLQPMNYQIHNNLAHRHHPQIDFDPQSIGETAIA